MIDIVPAISKEVICTGGTCLIPDHIGVSFGGFQTWCISAFCQRTGREVADGDFLLLQKDNMLPKEDYRLIITEKQIRIEASTEQGIIWALTTVAEWMEEDAVCCCIVSDGPKYAHRGLSLDCARHFFCADEVKKVIEEISLAKMNVLKWHLTDDQGWRIESKRFPKLHQISGSYYTQEEIRDICEFARARGIEIVPEVELPGHTRGLLAAYPQYSCFEKEVKLAKGGGIYPIVLCPGKEEVYAFLQELLGEIANLFPGHRFHIGGDETPKVEWKKCPRCQARMKQHGFASYDDLQGWFASRVTEMLRGFGKTAVCWNETLCSSTYPKDIQVQYWTLNHRNTMETFANAGGEWIYSDMFELYLDYPYAMTPLKKVYETRPHLGNREIGDMKNLLGMEGCIWSEHICEGERLENLLFPRLYALAELCWSGPQDYEDFCCRLKKIISGKNHRTIAYTPEEGWNPQGKKRQQEAFGYLAAIHAGMSSEVMEQTTEASAPGPEFGQAFMNKFFQPEDIPLLGGNGT